MTTPFPDYIAPSERKSRRNWLLRMLDVQEKYQHEVARALYDAAEDASGAILKIVDDDKIGSSVRRTQLRMAARATKAVVAKLFRTVNDSVDSGRKAAALAAVEAGLEDDERVLNRLFIGRPEDRDRFKDSMRQSAQRGVEAMMARVLESHRPLSERVYHTRALANGQVERIINSALVKGDSANDIAKAVRSSIRPDTPGGIGYAAKRLGRTEINNAFHAQSIRDVEEKPWVDRVEWRLSKVHVPQKCECERLAVLKTFAKDRVPDRPHPNCMCYIVPVLIPWDEFESNLIAGIYDLYIEGNH